MEIDKIDTTILAELSSNARVSMVDLATRVGLSSTAIARRQKSLEESGFIQGYQAVLDWAASVFAPLSSSGSPWRAKANRR
jgi:Lrp/AsnC family leucine-responsive transcriptional regulator